MNYEKWVKEKICESKGELIEIVCPFFKNNACSIYEQRFNCCRNFRQLDGYCAKSYCLLTGDKHENIKELCFKCLKNCCTKILVPKKAKLTKAFIKKWMDIDCQTCKEIFK